MKLVLAICNQKRKTNNPDLNTPILTYKNPGFVIPLHHWNNPEYFAVSFFSLFLMGTESYISAINSSRKYKLLLDS